MKNYVKQSIQTPRTVVTTSWDDGHKLDLRLAKLLKHYGIGGTFYIAPHDFESLESERLNDNEIIALAENFEIGAHTMTHRSLPLLSFSEARNEIIDSKKYLEKIIAKPVLSFCYPRGKYTSEHVRLVKESGFILARTVKRFALSISNDPFELATSIHTYNHFLDVLGVLNFAKWNPLVFFRYYRKWDILAMAMFDKVVAEGGVFHLWGHSWEIDEYNDWEKIEHVFKYISQKEGVHYLPNRALIEKTT